MSELTNIKQVSQFLNGDSISRKFKEILGKNSPAFISTVITAVNSNDMLKEATKESIYSSALTAATMNLPVNPNLGFAYLVPFKNSKKGGIVECQFQMGYKGYIQLAQRSGLYKTIGATPIYKGQLVSSDPLFGDVFDFSVDPSGAPIGYAAMFQLMNGFQKTSYIPIEKMEGHAKKYSQTYKRNFGLWKDEFDFMGTKTVLKLLISKFGPLSTDPIMQRAVLSDSAVINDVDTIDVEYPDNQTLSISQQQEEQDRERIINLIDDATSIEDLELLKDEAARLEVTNQYQTKLKSLKK